MNVRKPNAGPTAPNGKLPQAHRKQSTRRFTTSAWRSFAPTISGMPSVTPSPTPIFGSCSISASGISSRPLIVAAGVAASLVVWFAYRVVLTIDRGVVALYPRIVFLELVLGYDFYRDYLRNRPRGDTERVVHRKVRAYRCVHRRRSLGPDLQPVQGPGLSRRPAHHLPLQERRLLLGRPVLDHHRHRSSAPVFALGDSRGRDEVHPAKLLLSGSRAGACRALPPPRSRGVRNRAMSRFICAAHRKDRPPPW